VSGVADDARAASPLRAPLVVMGVAGSGKSTLGRLLAERLHARFIEGDDFHSADNRARMQAGVPLGDAERAQWLRALGQALRQAGPATVLACSALKRPYRDRLRASAPGLRFVFPDITPDEARERTRTRSGHFFPAALVDSQFDTLQRPCDEPRVLCLDGSEPPAQLLAQTLQWLQAGDASGAEARATRA
jgi:gluconokinase